MLLLALGISGCETLVPAPCQCPAYPQPPRALAPALTGETPLLDSWQKSKAELLQSLKLETGK